jgi:hypothetical protein
VNKIEETEDVLVIDYGTSFTTAGTYVNDKIELIRFFSNEPCELDPSTPTNLAECQNCGRCSLCPSIIAVKECKVDNVVYTYGHDAKNRTHMAKNSVFFDTKRWVNNYDDKIDVKDFDGYSANIRRNTIIESYLSFIIHAAEQQHKKRYKNISFTCPVKQKAMSVKMYREVLPEYNIEMTDVIDEAVAVVYDSIAKKVENLDYVSGASESVLLIDCGGGTSDMVKCDYTIDNLQKRSDINITVGYANGDTNFGGNNLTYRIMQYIKIKLALFYANQETMNVDELLGVTSLDIFDYIDTYGIKKLYEGFEQAYKISGQTIPTAYDEFTTDAESVYLNVRGNFYFLWNLAERIKIEFYNNVGKYEYSFSSLGKVSGYMVSVKNSKGIIEIFTACPPINISRDEINILLKPEIYVLLKNFIEPYYEEDRLGDITDIRLSGQTTKIDIFRDVLKEYVEGRKARVPYESSFSKKLRCINGAIAYHGARIMGRIHSEIRYTSAVVPYYLTVEAFNLEKEKVLITKGDLHNDIYAYFDRTVGTQIAILSLRDGEKRVLHEIKVGINAKSYKSTSYDNLLSDYKKLKQGDIDRILNNEIRIFIYSDDDSWGFKLLEVAQIDGDLRRSEPRFIPFEHTEWEMNFFDGKR